MARGDLAQAEVASREARNFGVMDGLLGPFVGFWGSFVGILVPFVGFLGVICWVFGIPVDFCWVFGVIC